MKFSEARRHVIMHKTEINIVIRFLYLEIAFMNF